MFPCPWYVFEQTSAGEAVEVFITQDTMASDQLRKYTSDPQLFPLNRYTCAVDKIFDKTDAGYTKTQRYAYPFEKGNAPTSECASLAAAKAILVRSMVTVGLIQKHVEDQNTRLGAYIPKYNDLPLPELWKEIGYRVDLYRMLTAKADLDPSHLVVVVNPTTARLVPENAGISTGNDPVEIDYRKKHQTPHRPFGVRLAVESGVKSIGDKVAYVWPDELVAILYAPPSDKPAGASVLITSAERMTVECSTSGHHRVVDDLSVQIGMNFGFACLRSKENG